MNEFFDINQTLPAQCILLGRRVTQIIDERLSEVGLSTAKLVALHSIATSEALVTVTCLADVMNTTKSNITAMMDRLVAEGLVTREHSLEDRRTVIIALTEEGEKRYREGIQVVRTYHEQLATMFSPQEQQLLNSILMKLPK